MQPSPSATVPAIISQYLSLPEICLWKSSFPSFVVLYPCLFLCVFCLSVLCFCSGLPDGRSLCSLIYTFVFTVSIRFYQFLLVISLGFKLLFLAVYLFIYLFFVVSYLDCFLTYYTATQREVKSWEPVISVLLRARRHQYAHRESWNFGDFFQFYLNGFTFFFFLPFPWDFLCWLLSSSVLFTFSLCCFFFFQCFFADVFSGTFFLFEGLFVWGFFTTPSSFY